MMSWGFSASRQSWILRVGLGCLGMKLSFGAIARAFCSPVDSALEHVLRLSALIWAPNIVVFLLAVMFKPATCNYKSNTFFWKSNDNVENLVSNEKNVKVKSVFLTHNYIFSSYLFSMTICHNLFVVIMYHSLHSFVETWTPFWYFDASSSVSNILPVVSFREKSVLLQSTEKKPGHFVWPYRISQKIKAMLLFHMVSWVGGRP